MKSIFIALFIFGLSQAYAEEGINVQALTQTQELLKDPKQRKEALDTPQAKQAAETVTTLSMGRPEIENQIFGISADLMTWVMEMSKSDPDFFAKLKQNSQDPAFVKKFLEKVPAAQREQIRNLASQIESVRSPSVKGP